MNSLRLSKLHATGNDFLVAVALDGREPLDAVATALLCDRHRGIGADGLITISPGRDGSDCTMTLVNADGGMAEMSGNGIRCLAWVADREGLGVDGQLVVDTAAGRRVIALEKGNGQVVGADVDMGPVTFDPTRIPVDVDDPTDLVVAVEGATYQGDAAGLGNPHLVLFVEDPATVPIAAHGPLLENDRRFPRRTNVEFVTVTGADRLTMRVWERGVGETQSCGTGACAAAAVAHRRGLVPEAVTVDVLGGTLQVRLGPEVTASLGGPVVHVFDVDLPMDRLSQTLPRNL